MSLRRRKRNSSSNSNEYNYNKPLHLHLLLRFSSTTPPLLYRRIPRPFLNRRCRRPRAKVRLLEVVKSPATAQVIAVIPVGGGRSNVIRYFFFAFFSNRASALN